MTTPRPTPNLDPLRTALAQAEALVAVLEDVQSFPPDTEGLINHAEDHAERIARNLRTVLLRAEADAFHALTSPAATLTPPTH